MAQSQAKANIRNILAEIYYGITDMRRVCEQAGLNTGQIAFDNKAINSWHAILSEAEGTNKVEALFNVVLEEYETHPKLRQSIDAYRAYIEQVGSSEQPLQHTANEVDMSGGIAIATSLEAKRLQTHQEAYTLWRKLVATVYDSKKIGDTVIECQEWWNNNCLYLSSDASTAFQSAYLAASHHGRFVEARESVQLIKENWADIEGAGDIIMASAASIRAGKLETDKLPGDKVGQDKVSAIVGDSAANVNIGKDNRNVSAIEGDAVGGDKHVINNYTDSSSLDGVPLSEEEKELLVAASQNEGEIFMINTQQVDFIRIRRNYIKDEEPSSAAPYREALEDLVERGYVRHDRGVIYKLTSAGRRQARSLGSKE